MITKYEVKIYPYNLHENIFLICKQRIFINRTLVMQSTLYWSQYDVQE